MPKGQRKETVKTVTYTDGPWAGQTSRTVAYDAQRIPVYDYANPLPQAEPPKGQKPAPKTFPVKGWYLIDGETASYSGM